MLDKNGTDPPQTKSDRRFLMWAVPFARFTIGITLAWTFTLGWVVVWLSRLIGHAVMP